MAALMLFREVDDVGRWLASPKRAELFGPLGMTARTFTGPGKANRVGLTSPALTPSSGRWSPGRQPRP
jgi:hypothetical protein